MTVPTQAELMAALNAADLKNIITDFFPAPGATRDYGLLTKDAQALTDALQTLSQATPEAIQAAADALQALSDGPIPDAWRAKK